MLDAINSSRDARHKKFESLFLPFETVHKFPDDRIGSYLMPSLINDTRSLLDTIWRRWSDLSLSLSLSLSRLGAASFRVARFVALFFVDYQGSTTSGDIARRNFQSQSLALHHRSRETRFRERLAFSLFVREIARRPCLRHTPNIYS